MFETLAGLPPDPILGVSVAYAADPNPEKIDLGVGVYRDDSGQTPILQSVKSAEGKLLEQETSKAYAPACGEGEFIDRYNQLAYGNGHPILASGRLVTAQTPGGCGALRVAAELVLRANPGATIWVPTPTWGNHQPLLGHAGVRIAEYRYYNFDTHQLDFAGMMDDLTAVGPDDLVLFHGCCHNPTGADLTQQQWQQIADLALERGFTPFVDMAYQGMADGIDQDACGPRLFAEKLPELILVGSCSKNFGLYRERTGAISIVAGNSAQAAVTQSQLANVIRGIYSTPPTHGAAIVSLILGDPDLRTLWQDELGQVRNRIQAMRALLTDKLRDNGVDRDFAFIEEQRGMFSFLGISADQVRRLRTEFSVYMLENSRISIAGINPHNIDRLAASIAAVL